MARQRYRHLPFAGSSAEVGQFVRESVLEVTLDVEVDLLQLRQHLRIGLGP